MKNVVVLCLNDYPIGAYSDRCEAQAARELNEEAHLSKDPLCLMGLHYHMHEFKVDAEAEA